MQSRDQIDEALKAIVLPELRTRQFKGSFPHFRRIHDCGVDLLTFQFDRNGGGFVLEIAKGNIDGFTTHWGKHIPAKSLRAWDLNDRKRLQPREGSGTDSWFRYDTGISDCSQLARSVLPFLDLADKYWSNKQPIQT